MHCTLTNRFNDIFSATRRPGSEFIVKEFERKISEFYGTDMVLTTLGMDTWLCVHDREIDNTILCFEEREPSN